jgi:hypothetical protein
MLNLQENDILPMQTFEISTNKTTNNTLIISTPLQVFYQTNIHQIKQLAS